MKWKSPASVPVASPTSAATATASPAPLMRVGEGMRLSNDVPSGGVESKKRGAKSPDGVIRIVEVRTLEELAGHADAWNKLVEHSEAASPMQSYPQINAFLETQLSPDQAWYCLFAYDGNELIGVLPLIVVRVIRLPGYSLCFFKTPHDLLHTGSVDCVASPGREYVIEHFVGHLMLRRILPVIRIREVPANSASMIYLNARAGGLPAIQFVSAAENFIDVRGDFQTYRSNLSSNFLRQLKRGAKKLEEHRDVKFLFREMLRSTSDNFSRFEMVENTGWKGDSNSSIKAMPSNRRLLQLAAEGFQNLGWMEWNFLECGDQPIAAHYAMRVGRVLYLLKIGYDENYSACSPGNLLLEKLVEAACASGSLDEINCVADCAWHRNWNTTRRLLHDVLIFPRPPIFGRWLSRLIRSKTCVRLILAIFRRFPALGFQPLTPTPPI